MTADLKNADVKRVRTRMADDARHQVKMLKSELDHYGDCFSAAERTQIRKVIADLVKLHTTIDP